MATRLFEPTYQPPEVDAEVRFVFADPSDDVSSVRTRLVALAGRRIALVLPNRSAAFDSPAMVHLLARTAHQESIRLAIVSGRRRVRYWAELEGIRTFSAPQQVPRRVPPPDETLLGKAGLVVADVWRQLCIQISWIAAIAIVLVIVGLGVLLIPRAEVYVEPVAQQLGSKLTIQASTEVQSADPQKGLVPGRQVYLAVDASGSRPISDAERPFDGRAVGYVALTNQTKDKILVPAGTDVSTISGVDFQTTQSVTLDGIPNATAVAPIRARYFGPAGNVKRGEISVMAAQLRWRVSVTNDDPTAGGGQPDVPVVTAWDTHKLVDQMTNQAQALARRRLAEQATPGEVAVPESIQVVPIAENFNHRIGDGAGELAVQMQFRASAMIVDQDEIRALAIQMWHPIIPSDFELRPGSVQVDPAAVVKIADQTVTFSVPVRAVAIKSINPDRIARYVRLRTPSAAERDLGHLFDLASPPRVTVIPNWIGRAYRVDVVLDANAPATSSPSVVSPDPAGGAR